jgi:hypothetical protein|tara:strand:+ start:347 stop:2848 length:2502 start_codon:yes stop_codon:yes gene_type:complete
MANDKQIENQRELNALQRLTMSMTGDMSSMMDDIIVSSDKRNKALKEDATITKQILADLKKTGDVNKTIAQIGTQIGQSKNKEYGVNQKSASLYQSQLIAIRGITTGQKEAAKAAQGVFDVTDEISSKFNSVLDNIDSFTKKIPIIGPALSNAFAPLKEKGELAISRATDGMKNGFIRQLTKAKKAGDGFATSFSKGIKGGVSGATKAISGTLGMSTALVSTLLMAVGIGVLLYAAFQIGAKRFKEIDAAAKSFRQETGLLNSQMGDLKSNIESISLEMGTLGVSSADVANAAGAFSNEMKGTSTASKGILTSMVAIEKSFGVSAATQAKVNNTFQLMSGASDITAQKMIQTTIAAAELAGVAPAAIMQDIAENAEAGLMHFRGSTKALANAAIEARRMGTSIGETAKVAEGLLDFESSITKELELGAMLGTRVNFNKARALAFEGKTVEAQKAVNAEVSKLGDINKMNMYQKQALMDATGMDLKSMIKQQSIAKKFKGIDDDRLEAANSLLDIGMSINDMNDEALVKEAKKLGAQKAMQSEMDKMANNTSALGASISDMFMPIATFLMPLLNDLYEMVNFILLPVFGLIGTTFKIIFGVLSAILRPIFALVKALVGAIMEPFKVIFDAIRPIGEHFEELGPKLVKGMEPVISFIKMLGKAIIPIIGMFVGDLVDGVVGAFKLIFSVFEAAYNFIDKYLIQPITSMINLIQRGISAIASLNPFGSSDSNQLQSGGSIDDGIVQGGKIISTHPEDTLIATKTPDSLLSNIAGGISGVVGGLMGGGSSDAQIVAKLDELITVMGANKDVYMDGRKVTAGVSSTVDKIGSNSYSLV